MKLAYLCETVIPSRSAAVVHVLKMCEAFSKLGHDVTLYYVAAGPVDMENVFSNYGVRTSFKGTGIPRAARRTFLYEYGIRAAWRTRMSGAELAVCRTLPGCLACTFVGVPAVYEAHMPTRSRGRITDLLFKVLLRMPRLRGVVVISTALKDYFEQNYDLKGRKVLVLPDAA